MTTKKKTEAANEHTEAAEQKVPSNIEPLKGKIINIQAEETPKQEEPQKKEAAVPETDAQEKQEKTPGTSASEKIVDFGKKAAAGAGKALGAAYEKAKAYEPGGTIKFLDNLLDGCRRLFPSDRFDTVAQ